MAKPPEVRVHGRPFQSAWSEMKATAAATFCLAVLATEIYGILYFLVWALRHVFMDVR